MNLFNDNGLYIGSFLPARPSVSVQVSLMQLRAYDNAAELQIVLILEARARERYYSVLNQMLPDDDFTYTKKNPAATARPD